LSIKRNKHTDSTNQKNVLIYFCSIVTDITKGENKNIIMRNILYLEERAMCTAGARNIQQQVATVCTGSIHPVLPPGGSIFWLHHSQRRGKAPHSQLTTAAKST
jgi:hypothetical protein